jgi:hypothetical protein
VRPGITAHDPWRVRIRGSDHRVHGAGVLIAPAHVLTCAHVVLNALGMKTAGVPPVNPVLVDFPTMALLGRFTAVVTADGWLPALPNQSGDLAILELNRQTSVQPAVLAACGPPVRRDVRAFGHPDGYAVGRWARAIISGTAGPTGEWVQLNDPSPTGPTISPGFSGAGVIEDGTGSVVGILVGVDTQASARGAWMISVEAAYELLPPLRGLAVASAADNVVTEHSSTDLAHVDFERHLTETLLRLDRMGSRQHRDRLVWAIERALNRPLRAPRHDEPRDDIVAVVWACLDHPDGDALLYLVQAARTLHGDTAEIRELARIASQDPGRRLRSEEIKRLHALVEELPAGDVAEASAVAFGPMGPRIGLDSENHAAVTRALAELLGGPGEAPPLLIFLQLLADRMHGPPATALREWILYFAGRWQVPLPDPREPERSAVPPGPQRTFLIVELREDGPNPDQYLLSIWLRHDTGSGHPLLVDDDQPLTMDEIPGHLGPQLRRVVANRVGPIGALTIEFVLPNRLLEHPVDQFRVAFSAPRAIGSLYPVVVRSHDRMMNSMIFHRWQARWRVLKEGQHRADSSLIRWVRPDGGTRQALEADLDRDPDGYTETKPVCLVIAMPDRAARQTLGAVRAGLDMGMPVMVWCRVPRLTPQFIIDMANELRGLPLEQLPAVVLRLRHGATVSGHAVDHPGRHVCLLWDDADRLPPSQALRAPR